MAPKAGKTKPHKAKGDKKKKEEKGIYISSFILLKFCCVLDLGYTLKLGRKVFELASVFDIALGIDRCRCPRKNTCQLLMRVKLKLVF